MDIGRTSSQLQTVPLGGAVGDLVLGRQEIFAKPIRNCEITTLRKNSENDAMKRNRGKKTPEARNLSRREVLGLIGATAAASLAGGPGEQPASAQEASAPAQNMKSRIVRLDAKLEPIAIDTAGLR